MMRETANAQIVRRALKHVPRDVVRAHDADGPLEIVGLRAEHVEQRQSLGMRERLRVCARQRGHRRRPRTREAQLAQLFRVRLGRVGDRVDLRACAMSAGASVIDAPRTGPRPASSMPMTHSAGRASLAPGLVPSCECQVYESMRVEPARAESGGGTSANESSPAPSSSESTIIDESSFSLRGAMSAEDGGRVKSAK